MEMVISDISGRFHFQIWWPTGDNAHYPSMRAPGPYH
jgi:hypothetical protein